jgi:hypothetical protein
VKFDIRDIPTYFINLETDVDKYTSTMSLLQYLEFKDVTKVDAIKAQRGCEKSHHKLLSDKSIPTPCLVLEDDILFTGNDNFIIEVPDDADALYLGLSEWGRFLDFIGPGWVHYEKVDDHLVRILNGLSAHAIIYLNEDYRNTVSRIARWHGYVNPSPFDIGVAEVQRYYNVYAVDVPIFKQGNYNNKVTSNQISTRGMNKEQADKFFDSKIHKLNELMNIPDSAGFRSHYHPIKLHNQINVKTQDPQTTSKQDTNLGSTTESVKCKDEGREGKDPS